MKEKLSERPKTLLIVGASLILIIVLGAVFLVRTIEQKSFFEKHIAPWAHLLMRDIEEAQTAVFYAPVGTMGRLFLEIESQAFEMDLTMRQ